MPGRNSPVRTRLHLAGMTGNTEDSGTLAYLQDTASQAGLATTMIDIESVGLRDDGHFVDLDDRPIELAFKLYPWEWMFHDAFGAKLPGAPTRWIEPPWKAILSNKGILPLLWEMFPKHPQPAAGLFRGRPESSNARQLVRAQAALLARGRQRHAGQRRYDACGAGGGLTAWTGFIRQAFAPMPSFSDQYPVLGSWLVDHTPCGLSIREDESPITGNTSRFVPHAIL